MTKHSVRDVDDSVFCNSHIQMYLTSKELPMRCLFTLSPRSVVALLLAALLAADIMAACPDEKPDDNSFCQNTAKVCSFTSINDPNCGGAKRITSCSMNVETRVPGPFQTTYEAGTKTKRGPAQLCVTDCICVLSTHPNACLRTCVSTTDPLGCQASSGDTVEPDGDCA